MRRRPDGSWQYSPTDLVAWLEGDFATWCEREAAEHRGNAAPPPRARDAGNAELELAARYGLDHEQAHLEQLTAQHPDLVEIDPHAADAESRTLDAMRAGRSVIFQARLEADAWMGIADFLHRVDVPSAMGEWSYEPCDTKLARSAKPYFLLQLATYAALLEARQSVRPSRLGFVLGDGADLHFRTDDFWYYYQRQRRRFEQFQATWDAGRMPDPGADRGHGRWSEEAGRILAARDDLSLVAGISRSHVIRLREAGIETVAALADSPTDTTPKGISAASMAKLREQAAMQLKSRRSGSTAWALRPPEPDAPGRGLALLPPPSDLDVFYDIEGFPYAPGGLEYLQGAVTWENGALVFHDWWAHDDATERSAFETFVDWVCERRKADPAMHVYHYAGYERAALARLSIKYASREFEIDELLRNDVLVDLYAVVRQGMVIGTPSYSLKDVEHLYMPVRDGEVVSAGASVVEYQRWIDSGEPVAWQQSPILKAIRDYNQVDCVSTAQLRDWLLARQREAGIVHVPRADLPEAPADREPSPREAFAEELSTRALALPEGEERRVAQLLAWLLEFHRRDDKPMWWRFFDRLRKDAAELYEDADCLAGLVRTPREPWQDKQSLVYEYAFDPEQETKLHEGSKVHVECETPLRTTIQTFDPVAGLLTMKLGVKRTLPDSCHLLPDEFVSAGVIADAIEYHVREWSAGQVSDTAVDDLIHRRPPRLSGHAGGPVIPGTGDLVTETIAAIRAMDHTTLAIQGPPGTGKTTTAARAIAALLDDGRRVGIVANSHAVVNNLLAKIAKEAPRHLSRLHKVGGSGAPEGIDHVGGAKGVDSSLVDSRPVVLGGTAWLFSRGALRGQLDYLFVDEAGQVSLANAVGAGQAAHNLVLVGDQMQLAQPTQGDHPGESGLSCLEYLLQGHQTIPAELGILLNTSYRMPPDLCRFISDAYYEGRLNSAATTRANRVGWDGPATGVRFVPVQHEGRTQSSDEECNAVADLVERLLGSEVTVESATRELALNDILIVAPFNAQVRALRMRLPEASRVGTVDKFQGQEAPVVIVSMSASTLDDAPRGAGFLLSPNRLNVAISRAQALALVVGSPCLGEVRARSVEEMRLVNGWCRVEECVV